jgi:acid phosphatase
MHSPLASYLSITENPDRLSLIKNFTMFHQDLENNKLPQWMFITPNMSMFLLYEAL